MINKTLIGLGVDVKNVNYNTTGYVVFEADKNFENTILKSVSRPSIIIAREDGISNTTLSAVRPDLNFERKGRNRFINFNSL